MNNEHHHARLTAGELSHLWEQYVNNSIASAVTGYLVEKVDCPEIRKLCSFALMTVDTQLNQMKSILKSEEHPLPRGFSEADVNHNAAKPVTDEFILFYLHDLSKMDLNLTAISLADAVRTDIRELFRDRMNRAMDLHQQTTELLLEKGMFIRAPLITSTHEAEPMAEGGFLSNWFGAGARTVTAREANELHKNVLLNYHGKSLLMALHQTNKNRKVQDFLLRGKEISSHIMKILSDVLIENDLPVTMTWDTHILDTRDSPFSDRLICCLLDQLTIFGISSYGYAAAVSARKDLKLMWGRIVAEVYEYETDLRNFMIENKWLERPPVALDRRELSQT